MENEERPAKRQRFSSDNAPIGAQSNPNTNVTEQETSTASAESEVDPKEIEVGITEFVSQDTVRFQGLLKKRYTDFLVNEILPSGKVVHLTDTSVPKTLGSSGSSKKKSNKKSENAPSSSNGDIDTTQLKDKSSIKPSISDDANGTASTEDQKAPQALSPGKISEEDTQQLISYLNETAVAELLELYRAIITYPSRKAKDHVMVRTDFTNDRSTRAEIHGAIRRIFSSKVESSTDKDGFLCLTAANPNTHRFKNVQNNEDRPYYPGKLGWLERGGEYLHFTLCKENKDTMEAIGFLTRQLKINTKSFQFAGTKDRRAVTAQRVSAYRLDAERLVKQNHHLRNAAVGNFEYKPSSLELGDLGGNEFVLTLRECHFQGLPKAKGESDLGSVQSALQQALSSLYTRGFLNYYGLQRFGTFSTRTDTIGLHILKNDFRSACEAILDYDASSLTASDNEPESEVSTPTAAPHTGPGRDEIARAKAIQLFQQTGNAHKPLELLPKKFSAENQIMRHLARTPTDYIGALLAIPRNLRLMYVHAYQSLVWNKAVTNRWQTFGSSVVEGDLVLVKEHKDKEVRPTTEAETGTVDADGEIIIVPFAHDSSTQIDDMFDRARSLTAAEAASGRYTIFDIVLPLPGYDIEYPSNATGQFYKDFMGGGEGGGLNPYDMRRKQKDFSLSGGYRKVMARIGETFSVGVHRYSRDEEQFVKTDLESIKEKEGSESAVQIGADGTEAKMQDVVGGEMEARKIDDDAVKDKIAAVLKFQLGASQYATMALRELSRGGVATYKPDGGSAR